MQPREPGAIIELILHRVAEHEDVPIEELPPVQDTIDVEALADALESEGVSVRFTYCGYRITLIDGVIEIQ